VFEQNIYQMIDQENGKEIKEVLDNNTNKIVWERAIPTYNIPITPTRNAPLLEINIDGMCTQKDTPTPNTPVNILCNNGILKMVDDELPSEYRRIESITFGGNTYYETEEKLYGTDVVTITLSDFVSSGQNLFGCYSGTDGINFSMYIYGTATGQAYWRYGSSLYRPTVGSTADRTITFGAGGTTGFKTNVSYSTVDFETDTTARIGSLPNSTSSKFNGTIVGSITVSSRLKYIPCERIADGVIGYYEAVNGVFLEPNGNAPVAGAYDNTHLHLAVVGTPEVLTVTHDLVEQTASVTDLFSVGDYKDEQEIISGAVTRRVGVVVFDGTEAWQLADTSGAICYCVSLSDAVIGTGRSEVLSSHFVFISSGQAVGGAFLSSKLLYFIPDQTITTVEAFTAWLAAQYAAGTPVIIVYPFFKAVIEQTTSQLIQGYKGETLTIIAQSDYITGQNIRTKYLGKENS